MAAPRPLTGERKWAIDMDLPDFACVLTTGGGVFNGDPGRLQAHQMPNLKDPTMISAGHARSSRVIDLVTNRSVVVVITDRGPRVRDRVLDLSLGAARSLGITDRGVAQVRVEVL
jgi:hypothetical protein